MVDKDYIPIGTTTPMMKFSLEVAEVKQKFAKTFKPFDEQCARLDFTDGIEKQERESERRNGFVKVDEIKIVVTGLEKYGDASRFELIEDKEETEFVIVNGIRTSTIAGHTMSYKCKERGHGIAVYVPIAEYEKLNDLSKSKGKKEE